MVLGSASVLSASPPYAPSSTNTGVYGFSPLGALTARSNTFAGLGGSSILGDAPSLTARVSPASALVGKSYDSALPSISPMTRSLTTMPWRPSLYYQATRVQPNTPLTRSAIEPLSKTSELIRIDDFKVPQVFSSARTALYTRYTPADWSTRQRQHYVTSDKFRNLSEGVRMEATRLSRETEDRTRSTQHDASKRLGERVSDIEFWRNEVNHETDYLVTETNQLAEAKRQVERALMETENPLHVAQENLYTREKRQGIDLVHDDPERQLLSEVDIIKRCQEEMRRTIDKANTQLALNRAAQHELEKDAQDKFSAWTLDEQCKQLHNTSRGIAFRVGVENIDNTVSVPESWAHFSHTNVQRSQAERAASRALRDEIDSLLARTHSDMWTMWNTVNNAFTSRIAEQNDAKHKTEMHLQKVMQEIFEMQQNIEQLKQAIQAKEAPLQVAQTRLDIRTRRPNIELCRDPSQLRLVSEVHEIYDTVERLQAKMRESEAVLQHLLNTKLALEDELSRKNHSIFLDREKCMGARQSFPLSTRL